MYYVYVLWSVTDKKFYIGYTADLERRIKEHSRQAVYSTSRFKSAKLVFYEAFSLEEDARRRERYFKTTKGKKALRLMLQRTIQ